MAVTQGRIPTVGCRHHLLRLTLESLTTERGLFAGGGRADRHGGGAVRTPAGFPLDGSRLPRLSEGFASLPRQAQDVLWLHLVEKEPQDAVSLFTGIAASQVDEAIADARAALRRRVIARNRNATDPLCRGFSRLLEVAADPADPRRSTDLEQHVATCDDCASLLVELRAFATDPALALARATLRSFGTAYAETCSLPRETRRHRAANAHPSARTDRRHRARQTRRSHRRVAGAVAVGLAVAVLVAGGATLVSRNTSGQANLAAPEASTSSRTAPSPSRTPSPSPPPPSPQPPPPSGADAAAAPQPSAAPPRPDRPRPAPSRAVDPTSCEVSVSVTSTNGDAVSAESSCTSDGSRPVTSGYAPEPPDRPDGRTDANGANGANARDGVDGQTGSDGADGVAISQSYAHASSR
ncbi:hypothetical protein [Streptomyces sp. NPDC060194]|uniref:hypothetical protein n=1 Tax=Streptomyces sp. NPDC060194 TaxID=3347069 RepID=UPI003648090F